MADEIIIKAPQIDSNITINISGEDQLRSSTSVLNSMIRGNKCYRYFKEKDKLYSELKAKCNENKISIPREQAKDILNTYNAYLACLEEKPKGISPTITNTLNSIARNFGDTLLPYSISEFKLAFSTLERLRAYGLNLDDFLRLFENIREI